LVGPDGTLSGEPFSADVGTNSFTVGVTDLGNLSSTANLAIEVLAPPRINSSITATATNLLLAWTGGIAPYQVQMSTNLAEAWSNLGAPVNTNTLVVTPTNAAAFYRILGR
jgi:hypothetical protein